MKSSMEGEEVPYGSILPFLTYVIVKVHVEISIEQKMVKINLHTY